MKDGLHHKELRDTLALYEKVADPKSGENRLRNKTETFLKNVYSSPSYLWIGTSLRNMVDHSFQHSANMLRLFVSFVDSLRSMGNPHGLFTTAEELSAFQMAAMLHDIGQCLAPHHDIMYPTEIRRKHGLISAELIINEYDAYRLSPFGKNYRFLVAMVCAFHQVRHRLTRNTRLNSKRNREPYCQS